MRHKHDSIAVRLLAIGVSPFALMGAVCLARAEESPTQQVQAAEQGQLQEVVVTSQRRTEALKDVPVSVQTISGAQLSQAAVSDTRDLAELLPTVNFSNGARSDATAFSLRGVSSLAFQNGIQPSTAMVVDGVPLARQVEFLSQLGDISRIEVLNGPQGTLFGKNSTAGVISIVTNLPSHKFETEVEGLATNDTERSIRGMVNVPVSDGIRLRLNAFYDDQPPLIKNLGPAPDVMGVKAYGVNLKAAFDLASNVDFVLSGSYSYNNNSNSQFVAIGPSVNLALERAVIGSATICRCDPTIATDEPAVDIYQTRNVTGTLNWALSDNLSLVSITSYSKFNEDSTVDSDLTPVGVLIGTGELAPGAVYPFQGVNPGFRKHYPVRAQYESQEIRLNARTGPVNTVLGGYIQEYHDSYSSAIPTIDDGSLVGKTPGVPYFTGGFPAAKTRDTTASIFGDSTVAVNSWFKVFGGVRFTRERIGVHYLRNDYLGPASQLNEMTGDFGLPPIRTVIANSTHQLNNVSGRVGVEFEPTRELNFYASYARGYKGPAVDESSSLAAGRDPIIQPETADSYEVGSKLRLFDNRLAVNVAVFDERIHNAQLGIFVPTATGFSVAYINAGALNTKGVELDSTWAVTAQLRLRASLAYDDATYAGFNYKCNPTQVAQHSCPNYPVAGFQSEDGKHAIGSPKVKYSLGGDYSDTFPGSEISYYVAANWTWTDAIFYELNQDPVSREPAYGLLSASVGVRGRNDRWEVQLFGKNLTNRLYFSQLTDFPLDAQPFGYLNRDYKRYGGVKLIYRY